MNVFARIIILFTAVLFYNCVGQYPLIIEKDELKNDIINAKHVIFIGIDGFGSAYIQNANIPTIKKMINGGTFYTNTYNLLPSNSYINWPSLFRGTEFKKQIGDNFPSIFTIIKNKYSNNNVSFFYKWDELKKINPNGFIEEFINGSDLDSAEKFSVYIKENKPVFSAVVFDDLDAAGHKKGWGSKSYYKKLEEIDNYISMIIQASIDSGIFNETVFVLSADHGGFGLSHNLDVIKNRKIPLIFYGQGVKKGYISYKSVSICEIAPTIAFILGTEAPPEWTGYPLTDLFE